MMMLQVVIRSSEVVAWDFWWLEMVYQLMKMLQQVIAASGMIDDLRWGIK